MVTPTIERIQEIMSYDPETGIVSVKKKFGRRPVGAALGYADRDGYLRVRIDGVLLGVHRVAWAIKTGAWPLHEIDHKNGCTNDNRWCNMRDVSVVVNQQNQRSARKDNQCGLLGVSIVKNGGAKPFRADIRYGGRQNYLGRFSSSVDAHAAYLKAKAKHHPGSTISPP